MEDVEHDNLALWFVLFSGTFMLFQCMGLYLLIILRHRIEKTLILFLLCLASTELQTTVIVLFVKLLSVWNFSPPPAFTYLLIIYTLLYCCLVAFISMNQFLEEFLHLKYHLYWNPACTKVLLIFTHLAVVASLVACVLKMDNDNAEILFLYVRYINPSFDIAIILLLFPAYSYILFKLALIQTKVFFIERDSTKNDATKYCVMNNLKQKRKELKCFIFPGLMFATFVAFVVIPDAYYISKYITVKELYTLEKQSKDLLLALGICKSAIGVINYLFFCKPIRTYMGKKYERIKESSLKKIINNSMK